MGVLTHDVTRIYRAEKDNLQKPFFIDSSQVSIKDNFLDYVAKIEGKLVGIVNIEKILKNIF